MSSSTTTNKCGNNYDLPKNSSKSILKNSIHYLQPSKIEKLSYEIVTNSNSSIKNYQISNSSISLKGDKNILNQIKYLSKEKIIKKYNLTKEKYNIYNISYILRNDYCHIVSLFKDMLINCTNIEYFYKYHKKPEINELMKKFYPFYKTYFNFYCKPIFNNISLAMTMKHYFDKKAKCFLNIEYNNDNSNFEEIISKKNSESSETTEKESKIDKDKIFNSEVKDALDNVTIMTTLPDYSDGKSINLNFSKERIEIYRENKNEYSNDTTFKEIVDDIKNERIIRSNINNINKLNKMRNKLRTEFLKNKNNIIKNYLNFNKNCIELIKIKNKILINKYKDNKKKNPINKLNILLKKIKENNIRKKLKSNVIEENIDKSLEKENKKDDDNKSINSSNENSNRISNLGKSIVKSSLNNNNEKQNTIQNIENKNITKEIIKNYKTINGILKDSQNKENKNKEINYTNINNNRNIKKINKSINNIKVNKDNKIINQKITLKNKKRKSRNKYSLYQSIQSISSFNQNLEKNHNSKNKKISLHKTFAKNQSNNSKNAFNGNENLKTIVPFSKVNHLRHKTKFIKYQNVEQIFHNIYSKIKKQKVNNNNFHTIHINNDNKSNLFKTSINDNNLMNTINFNNINSPNNIPINTSISNTFLKKSIYNSIYNSGSYKIIKNKGNPKIKFKFKKNITNNQRYSININQNSISIIHNHKSHSLNKTSENNYFLNNFININITNSFKKSNKSLSKKKKFICSKKLKNIYHKKNMTNIKTINNNSLNNKGKAQINIDENKYKDMKKIYSFSNKRKNKKSSKLKEIFINIKKETKKNKYDVIKLAKKYYYEKNKERNSISINDNNKINNRYNFILNSLNNFKSKDKKYKVKNLSIRNKIAKTIVNNSRNNIDNSNHIKTNNIIKFHNKSQSTYGLELNNRKFMKFKM